MLLRPTEKTKKTNYNAKSVVWSKNNAEIAFA